MTNRMLAIIQLMIAISIWSLLSGCESILKPKHGVFIPDANLRRCLIGQHPKLMARNYLDTSIAATELVDLLDLSGQQIKSLEGVQYLKRLKALILNNNPKIRIGQLPDSLTTLYLNDCGLEALPNPLPPRLTRLYCDNNHLRQIPALPITLVTLLVGNNELKDLPALPNQLEDLSCYFNQIEKLPTLPTTLLKLHCNFNQIGSVPTLPNYLVHLYWANNPAECLSNLPDSIKYYDKLPIVCPMK